MDPNADEPLVPPARPVDDPGPVTVLHAEPVLGEDTGALPVIPAAAPSVVAVIVVHDPGSWFEEALASFGVQDYPSLSVLVVDAGSAVDPTPRVAEVLPGAYVRRLDTNPGFGPAANEVLEVVDGAAFYLLCHDDVALAPDAVRALVEESYRSNAGVAGPKLVDWDEPHRLRQVGLLVDKTGYPSSPVEPGELDQEQHDAVRDVFAVPGAATLVRADLFATLGGYEPHVPLMGDDVDLCWRAQVAGARVVTVPAAVGRHVEALGARGTVPVEDRRRFQMRHRLWSLLTCYGRWHRIRVVPQAFVLALVEVAYSLAAGRRRQAADIVGAYRWNWRHRKERKPARARLERIRTVPDAEVRRLQVGGSARFSAFLRGQIGSSDDRVRSLTRSAGSLAGSIGTGALRTRVATWLVLVLVLVAGSRAFLSASPPALVDLPPFPSRPWPLLAEFLSGWRTAGLGSEAPAPTAFGLFGAGGLVFLGSMATLAKVLVIVPLLAGPIGAARLLRPTRSVRASLVAAVAYAAVPVPYNALAEGRWGGLVAWSATPWIIIALTRAHAGEPYDRERRGTARAALGLGFLVAVAGALTPLLLALPLVVAVALVLGGVLTGSGSGTLRAIGTAVGATVVAVVLHLPWAIDFVLPDATWAPFGGVGGGGAPPSLAELLRFELGPLGSGPVGFAFLVAAALPLLIGQGWRLRWAVRAWALVVVSVTLAWVAGLDGFPVPLSPPEVLLAPAACGLALATALGVVAFEVDLPGYRFGWRQAASFAAAAALAVGTLPVLVASLGGRWDAPAEGYPSVLSFLDREQSELGAFRTLWLGDPAVLPLGGWAYADGIAYATTDDGLPTVADRWPGTPDDTSRLIGEAIALAERGETSRLGRLLAPMGIRYVVVTEADRPLADPPRPAPASPALLAALGEQLDLGEVEVDTGLRVFRNAAWTSSRSLLADTEVGRGGGAYVTEALDADLAGSPSVLARVEGPSRFEGPLDEGDEVLWASAGSPRWRLEVDGQRAARSQVFGWANAFTVPSGGDAVLRFDTPITRHLLLAGQGILWVLVASMVRRARRAEAVAVEADAATGGSRSTGPPPPPPTPADPPGPVAPAEPIPAGVHR